MAYSSPKSYIIDHPYVKHAYGVERRRNLAKEALQEGTILPKTLKYDDIDNAFKDFVENGLEINHDGKKLPTMMLLSNQRFSEYAQSWQYVDNDRNIIMNFKTVTRDPNPMPGDNQGGNWNIPGERFYPIAKVPVLDKNGTESWIIYKMKQPYCVDLLYQVSIFTNSYQLLNEFNSKVNDKFKARQCYIRPNGHFLPMIIQNISDESEYNIDDRKYFSQSFDIKVSAYIINEEDLSVSQIPMRKMVFFNSTKKKNKPKVEIDDSDYMNKAINLHISFPAYEEKVTFNIDTDMKVESFTLKNARYVKLHVNGSPVFPNNGFRLKDGDELQVKIGKLDITKESEVLFEGISEDEIIMKDEIVPESVLDSKNPSEDIYIQ